MSTASQAGGETHEGAVTYSLDAFRYKVICGEIQLAILYNPLLGQHRGHPDRPPTPSCSPSAATGAQEPAQGSPPWTWFSTGTAAQMAANNLNIGAIASSLAISTYGLAGGGA